jgi:hypothetical protein
MYIINLSNPTAILIALLFTVLCIILGKEFKKSVIPAIALGVFLLLILMHLFQSFTVQSEIYKSMLTKSISIDAIMIFLSYISYMWVDDIEAKEKNKKSIDNSLDWFWKKI